MSNLNWRTSQVVQGLDPERNVSVASELDVLMETVGKRGYLFQAFHVDRNGPDVLAAVRDFGECADALILIDEQHAYAYRTPTGPDIDLYHPTHVYWSYAASPGWTLRALMTLPPPGHPNAPTNLTQAPQRAGDTRRPSDTRTATPTRPLTHP